MLHVSAFAAPDPTLLCPESLQGRKDGKIYNLIPGSMLK